MPNFNNLSLLYTKSGSDLYGVLAARYGELSEKKQTSPFIISTQIGETEIVHGSISNLLFKIERLTERFSRDQVKAYQFLKDRNIKPITEKFQDDGKLVVKLPQSKETDLFLYNLEERMEDMILLVSIYFRSLIEIFGEKIDEKLTIYSYEGEKSPNVIALSKLIGMFMHYRYFLIRNEYIVNVFSDKQQLSSGRYFDGRIKYDEFLQAIRYALENIKLRDFLDVLESRINKLSAQSEAHEIIFMVQNVHSLKNIIRSRMQDPKIFEVLPLVLRAQKQRLKNAQIQCLIFSSLSFEIPRDLSNKKITISSTFNKKLEKIEIRPAILFGELKKAFGNDPLISFRSGCLNEPSTKIKPNDLP